MKDSFNSTKSDVMELDILKLAKYFVSKAWLLILVAVLTAALTFGYTALFVTPEYQSVSKIYVNNNGVSLGESGQPISGSNISAAQSLVNTYIEILYARSTLELVIDEADLKDAAGNRMNYMDLKEMVEAGSLNGTEIFQIVVTDTDPERAMVIANTITRVLPMRISAVVDGSSMRVVDEAQMGKQTGPRYVLNTILGFLVGFVVMAVIELVLLLNDNYIYDEEYLLENYRIPLLAIIPDLSGKSQGQYGKRKGKKYGYSGYGRHNSYAYEAYQAQLDQKTEERAKKGADHNG